jgi:hypothetical protein
MTTQLIILPNGRAKEIHPMGEKPKYNTKRSDSPYLQKHIKKLDKWFDIESSLKEYEILNLFTEGWFPTYNNPDNFNSDPPAEPRAMIGDIVTCEINQEEGTAIII